MDGGSQEIGERLRAPILPGDHAANYGQLGVMALVGQNFTESFQRFFEDVDENVRQEDLEPGAPLRDELTDISIAADAQRS